MDKEDGYSSEGIVASSDEEYDGLSEAVGQHIFMQEKRAPEYHSIVERPYSHGPLMHERKLHNYDQHFMKRGQDRRFTQERLRPISPPRPYSPTRHRFHSHEPSPTERHLQSSHVVSSRYSLPLETYPPPPEIPYRMRLGRDLAHPSTSYNSFPPHLFARSEELIRRDGHDPPFYEQLTHSDHNRQPHSGSSFNDHVRPDIEIMKHRPFFREDMQIGASYGRPRSPNSNPQLFRQHHNYLSMDQPREAEPQPRHPNYQAIQTKVMPKPVNFKIKAKSPPKLHVSSFPNNLFSPASTYSTSKKSESPEKWPHDKYEQENPSPAAKYSKPEKSDSKERRSKRTRSTPDRSSSLNDRTNQSADDVRKKRLIDKNEYDGRCSPAEYVANIESTSQQDGKCQDANNITKNNQEEVMVYEVEEEVVEDDQISQQENSNSEDDEELLGLRFEALSSALSSAKAEKDQTLTKAADVADSVSSEDDEELLGLRLHALTSALDTQNRAEDERTEHKERQKPKFPLKRIVESSDKSIKKKKSRKRSEVAHLFMKKHISISKHRSPERPSPALKQSRLPVDTGKPNKAQLTLFSEIIKNHQTPTKTDALRYIRSHPDENVKTEMFLNLMKRETLSVPEAVNLAKQSIIQKKTNTTKKVETEPKTVIFDQKMEQQAKKNESTNVEHEAEIISSIVPVNNKKDEIDETNYDEIEMDLSEGDSDSDLMPPGTDDHLIPPPQIDTPKTPGSPINMDDTAPLYKTIDACQTMDFASVLSPDLPNTTPSQESIWIMLEHPVESEKSKVSNSKKGCSDLKKVVEGRQRNVSEEVDIDDDSLIMLREKLLKQIDSSKKESSGTSVPINIGKVSKVNIESIHEAQHADPSNIGIAFLPSQYPYQPPTLQTSLMSKFTSTACSNSAGIVPPASFPPPVSVRDRPDARLALPQNAARPLPQSTSQISLPQIPPSQITLPTLPLINIPSTVPQLPVYNPYLFSSDFNIVMENAQASSNIETESLIAMSQVNLTSSNYKKKFNAQSSTTTSVTSTAPLEAKQVPALKSVKKLSKGARKRRNRRLKKSLLNTSNVPKADTKAVQNPALGSTPKVKPLDSLKAATTKKSSSVPPVLQTPTIVSEGKFSPPLASTPALPLTPVQQMASKVKKASAAKKERQKRYKQLRLARGMAAQNGLLKIAKTSEILDEKSKILKPSSTNITTTPKTQQTSSLTSKARKLSTSTSQTLFKSATTIIKKNHTAGKRAAETASPDQVKRKVRVITQNTPEHPAQIRLPRHQPVVINIGGSSDEDESVLSPTRKRGSAKNPDDLHRDMLDAMIKQVRQQTTIKQKMGENLIQPYAKASDDKGKLSQVSLAGSQEQGSDVAEIKSQSAKVLKKSLEGRNQNTSFTASTCSPSELKSASRKLTQENASTNSLTADTSSIAQLKQTKVKFLKLKAMIGKDEISYNRLMKIKESKKAELKLVENELKEMIYRVAAIKGKAARCEEIVRRYTQQELKMKKRLEKRNEIKLKLRERIKRRMLHIRAEQREIKNIGMSPAQKQSQIEKAATITAVTTTKSSENIKKNESNIKEKQRLLAVEQKLAAKINLMKKSDGKAPVTSRVGSRRVSLSKEVQSQLERYKEMQKENRPSAHDLSLSKIAIPTLSPVRKPMSSKASPVISINSPSRKLLNSPARNSKPSSPAPVHSPKVVEEAVNAKTTGNKKNEKQAKTAEEQKSSTASEIALKNLRKSIEKSMSDVKPLLSGVQCQFAELPFSNKSWEKKAPAILKIWKVDMGEVLQTTREETSNYKTDELKTYTSPLHNFRSYRLNPFMRTKEKLMIKSKTFSHKINPEQIFCRYDLTGTCQDPNCKAQHSKQYQLESSEVILDLISYCPELLGKNVNFDSNYQELVKLAESTCDRLCGISSKQTKNMSIDEKCILIASKVNTALNNKPPSTTIFKPRIFKPKQDVELTTSPMWKMINQEDLNDFDNEDKESRSQDIENFEHPDYFVKGDERYFVDNDQGTLRKIEDALKRNPHNIQLWLELSYRKMSRASVEGQSSLELALHTMCLALEENPYVGELWGHYLGLLRHRKSADRNEDLDEMVSQAVELVPLSPHVWNQLLSWDCNVLKREFLYDQLISNLLRNIEDFTAPQLPPEVASRWLLQTVLQRTQLHLSHRKITEVLPILEVTVKEFSQQCQKVSSPSFSHAQRCLTSSDLNHLWLAYINVVHFSTLPQCFFPSISSAQSARNYLGLKVCSNMEVHIDFNNNSKLDEQVYSDLHADLDIAIKEYTSTDESLSSLYLLQERLRLEMTQQKWENASDTCKILCKSLTDAIGNLSDDSTKIFRYSEEHLKKILTEISVTWADVLVKKGDNLGATKVFEEAVTENPSDSKLCYEAALFQLNQESTDIDAALLYFETCASAYLKIDMDIINLSELKKLFNFLLRLSFPSPGPKHLLLPEISWNFVSKNKAYLWMIYIVILESSGDSVNTILDCYEKAIVDVGEESERRQIWLRYLRYRQQLAPKVIESTLQAAKTRQVWLKNFTAVIRRCLITCSSDLPIDDYLSSDLRSADYTFHNQVASIYLSCFHTRQHISTAYIFLTDLMPYNVPLLLRACRHFLNFGDHTTVISTLWKITSNTACQNKMIWKISINAHFSRGRIMKAIHMSRRSVDAMPYSRELWSDYLALLKAYVNPEDFIPEKVRCSSWLQMDAQRLLPPTP